jgi:cell division protein FtsQ
MATRTTPARKKTAPSSGRAGRVLRRVGAAALVLALGAAWYWQQTLPLRRVDVTGVVHADAAEVVRLTGVRPDSDAVFALSPALVADRAERHPWVRRAHVRRLPTGTLSVRVEEREPVVLVMRAGVPAGYLDAEGVALPLDALSDSGAVPYDVPLLTGSVPDAAPGARVASPALRELLAALAGADDATDALVSEVEWRAGRAVLWTTPAGGHPSVPVRLGRTGVADQLARLRAFWDQSVLARPRARFRSVDLRFEGQVVTQEGAPPAPDSTRSTPGLSTPVSG